MHLLLAWARTPAGQADVDWEAALRRIADDADDPRLSKVTPLDLGRSPRLGRLRVLLGFGWQARDWVHRPARLGQTPVDAVLEVDGLGDRHLLGLGRTGVPALRVVPAADTGRQAWLDRLAAREGALLLMEPGVARQDLVRAEQVTLPSRAAAADEAFWSTVLAALHPRGP